MKKETKDVLFWSGLTLLVGVAIGEQLCISFPGHNPRQEPTRIYQTTLGDTNYLSVVDGQGKKYDFYQFQETNGWKRLD